MPKGTVYYCSDLKLYRFTREAGEDGEAIDYKFDEDELVATLGTHMANGATQEAEFVSWVTGLGRINPHKIVEFEDGKIVVRDPKEYWAEKQAEEEASTREADGR